MSWLILIVVILAMAGPLVLVFFAMRLLRDELGTDHEERASRSTFDGNIIWQSLRIWDRNKPKRLTYRRDERGRFRRIRR